MQNLVYEWVDFSKFGQIWAKIGSNLRKYLFKIWPKIGPTGIWMGYFFLKTGICMGLLQILWRHTPKPNLSTPRDLDMEINEEVVTRYFSKNIINHKFVQYILLVSSGNLKPMLK